jgi:hypothetical protein
MVSADNMQALTKYFSSQAKTQFNLLISSFESDMSNQQKLLNKNYFK